MARTILAELSTSAGLQHCRKYWVEQVVISKLAAPSCALEDKALSIFLGDDRGSLRTRLYGTYRTCCAGRTLVVQSAEDHYDQGRGTIGSHASTAMLL